MDWMDVLSYVIKMLAGIVITVGIPYAFSIIKSKVNNDHITKYLELSEKYLKDTVTMINQTFVNSLKAEGKFDIEAQKKAFNEAKETWLAMMSEEMKTVVINATDDIDTFIRTKIESMVVECKG